MPDLRVLALLLVVAALAAAEIVLPDDPRAVLDAKKEGGAVGDGVADDTEALQKAIEACTTGQSRILYLPKGTYRITRPLTLKKPGDGTEGSMLGPWIYGQERDGTVIRLADGADGFGDPAKPRTMVNGLARPEGARMNADFFDRTLVNLTLDAGRNPGAIGIRFYSNNTGLMQHVVVRGDGAIGIDLGSHDQNGPLLIQDVAVEGFAVGIRTAAILNSQTLSRVAIAAREVGLRHQGQVLAAEALTVRGAPLAIDSDGNGVLTLVDCRLEGKDASGPAVRVGEATLYAQRLTTVGFVSAIATADAAAKGPGVAEFASQPVAMLDAGAPSTGLGLKPDREPEVPFPTRADQWVCANDFGAAYGDDEDDGPALQKAIDAAAAKGAKAVYLRGADRGDPNWYWLRSEVRIHGSVERVMGFGFARILGGDSSAAGFPENLGRLVVDDDPAGARAVIVQHLKQFSPVPSVGYEARTAKRTLVLRSAEGTLIARAGARAFVSNMAGTAVIGKGARVAIRQWNTERTPGGGTRTNTLNDGGVLWILGMKTEAPGTKLVTRGGGRSEVLGVHNYNTGGVEDATPFFRVEDAALSVAGYREVNFTGQWWKVPVLAAIGGSESRHPPQEWQTWALLRAGR